MTSRRTLLAAAAALPALPAAVAAQTAPGAAAAQSAPGTAAAQAANAPAAAQQAPGFLRMKLGTRSVLAVNDGFGRRTDLGQGFVRNAPLAEVEGALREAFLPTNRLDIPYTIPFLETADGLVAFDTGTGGQLGATAGRMIDNLRAAGHAPSAVRHVVFTHFHGDHVSGLTDAAGTPIFPQAQLHVPAPEWAYWLDEAQASRAPEAARPAFANVRRRFAAYEGRVRPFEPGVEVLPGVRSVATHGHSPGHTSFILSDGDDRLLVFGDVTNRPELFVRHPGWHAVFDQDPTMAEATRRRVLDMVVADRLRVLAYHWPFPANGYVARDGEGYRFVPAEWSSVV